MRFEMREQHLDQPSSANLNGSEWQGPKVIIKTLTRQISGSAYRTARAKKISDVTLKCN